MEERRHYIDNLRSFAVLSVVVFHTVFIFGCYSTRGTVGSFDRVQYQDIIAYLINPWLVSVLFLVAGISSRIYLQKHTVKEYLKQRALRCLVPSTLGVLTFHFIEGYIGARYIGRFTDSTSYFNALILGVNAMWYLWLLWLFSLIAALTAYIEKGRLYRRTSKAPLIPFLVPVWMCFQFLNLDRYFPAHIGGYSALFMLGFFVLAHNEPIERLSRNWYVPATAATAFGIWYIVKYYGSDFVSGEVVRSPVTVAYGYLSCLTLIAVFKHFFNKETEFFLFLRKNCFGIYVFHYLPLCLSAYLVYEYTLLAPPLCYLITLVSAISGSLILHFIISKIPLLRFCTLGTVKRKENR